MRSWGTGHTCTRLAGAAATALCLVVSEAHAAEPAAPERAQQNASRAASARVVAAADPKVLQEARQLLATKKAKEAYELLAPHEYDWAGDRDYDYLLGAAAVDSGKPSEAVLALQRSLATDPEYSAARMELARAYYDLGDYDYAKSEFDQLKSEDPPEYARRVIDNYLLAIEKRTSAYRPNFQYWFEVDAGYDTNANGSTADENFLGFTLDDRNVETDSLFVGFSQGGIWSNPLTPRVTNYNQIGLAHRRNFSATFVNSDRLSASSALVWRHGPTSVNGGVGAYLTFLDSSFLPFSGDKNQHGLTLDLGARHLLDEQWLIGGDIRAGLARYADELDVRDVDQLFSTASAEYLWPGPSQARFGVTVIGGNEDAVNDLPSPPNAPGTPAPFSRDQGGLRLTSSWLLTPTARSYLFAGTLNSDYDEPFFGASEKREDRQTTLGGYVIWRAFSSQNWALVPRLTYVDNKSNVPLYEYDRVELGLAMRFLTD